MANRLCFLQPEANCLRLAAQSVYFVACACRREAGKVPERVAEMDLDRNRRRFAVGEKLGGANVTSGGGKSKDGENLRRKRKSTVNSAQRGDSLKPNRLL